MKAHAVESFFVCAFMELTYTFLFVINNNKLEAIINVVKEAGIIVDSLICMSMILV